MTRRHHQAMDCLPAGDSMPRRWRPLAIGAIATLSALGCDDDDDAFVGQGMLNPAASSGVAGNAGAASTAGSGEASAASSAPIDAGSSVDRNVFRPEEVAATPELMSRLRAPDGFRVRAFAEDVGQARMLVARGAQLYVTRPDPGDVLRLADTDGDGNADERTTVATGLPLVHGIAFRGDQVYLATDTQVLLASVDAGGAFGPPAVIIDDLPDGGQHPRRTLGISPADELFISVGSSCDACDESNDEHATMLVAALDGSSRAIYASGLRNTIGFAWHPTTRQLWGMDHGSDWRGDDIPPEELNAIVQGTDYGWPYCYGDRRVDPVIDDPPQGTKQQYCAMTSAPVLSTQAHNAPIGFAFYTGASFPTEYQGDAFIAMHGSWNRLPPTGYEIVRLVFDEGVPQRFESFITGFLSEDGSSTFGRPAGITVAPDGALLFSDDSNGVIYRVSYGAPDAGASTGPEPDPTPPPVIVPVSDAGGDAG
jgi:glucose/arabinose dehydrogenase